MFADVQRATDLCCATGNSIGDEGAKSIVGALKCNTSVAWINLNRERRFAICSYRLTVSLPQGTIFTPKASRRLSMS